MRVVIGLDVGHSAVKVAVDHADGRDDILFPSVATGARELTQQDARVAAERETVEVDGRRFFFGETAITQGIAEAESGLSEGWISTPQYAALVAGAFRKIGQLPSRVKADEAIIVVGLPAKLYGTQRDALVQVMQRLAPGALVKVLPQPMGPYLCIHFDDEGKESRHRKAGAETWGIVEIGHFTTDLGVVRNGLWIDKYAGSCSGGRVVVERVAQLVKEERGHSMSLLEATRAVVDGGFLEYGEFVPIQPFVAKSVQVLADEVMDTISRLIERDARGFHGVAVAGGAAQLLYPIINAKFKHAVIAENSRMTVAEGFRRFGCGLRNDLVRKAQRSGPTLPAVEAQSAL